MRGAVPSGLPLVLAALALGACDAAAGGRPPPAVIPPQDTSFGGLVAGLSEPGGYFDTDNLISNEASYLHVVGALDSLGIAGGAYLGVGPDQNFSYIAAVRPAIAFLVDIRRDNLLQHLWLRALFDGAESRLDYLCAMIARDCGGPSADLDADGLVRRVDAAAPLADPEARITSLVERAASYGVPLDDRDRSTIREIHERFAAAGLDLRFNTHGRAPRAYYPMLRDLIRERTLDGRQASYLADDAAYAFVRGLQREGRIIPVVGDLAGPHALRAIGAVVRSRGERVRAFYVSNVEFYLFRDGTYAGFVENLGTLPMDGGSVLVRSVFRSPVPLPAAVPGYASVQALHGIPSLLRAWEQGRITSYRRLLEASVRD